MKGLGMTNGLNRASLALTLFISVLMLGGCSTMTSPEQVEENMRDLLYGYTDVNEVRRVLSWRHYLHAGGDEATPLMAAILLAPDRVPQLIEEGANTNGFNGQVSPLWCATFPAICGGNFLMSTVPSRDDISLMKVLLDNGADPDSASLDGGVVVDFLCSSVSPAVNDDSINKLKLFSEYGTKATRSDLFKCDLEAKYSRLSDKKKMLIEDISKHGMKEALELWSKPDEYRGFG